jgi:hypothetical protein
MFFSRKPPHLTLDSLDARLRLVEAILGQSRAVRHASLSRSNGTLEGALASYGEAIAREKWLKTREAHDARIDAERTRAD